MKTIRAVLVATSLLVFGGGCHDDAVRPPVAPRALAPSTNGGERSPRPASPPLVASPLVSRGKRTAGYTPVAYAQTKFAIDAEPATVWNAGKPTAERPAWIAIDVGQGPSRLLVRWSAHGSYNYEETDYGSPGSYRIEVSSDSLDGEGGTWTNVVTVADVKTHAQAHAIPFSGMRWVRFVVTSAPAKSPNGVQLDDVSVHDASSGATDTWLFMGDSITAFAFGRQCPPQASFSALVAQRHPGHQPLVINAGMGGEKSADGRRHLADWLARNPDIHVWGIGYGTNEAAGDVVDAASFRESLREIATTLAAAGRVPILARIPYASSGHPQIPRLNEVVDELTRELGLPAGPDLYAWFRAHPDELGDGVHPNDRGIASMNRLWADAVAPLYPPSSVPAGVASK